jgi:molybdopterin-dependent oxidoreductase alpha subunit
MAAAGGGLKKALKTLATVQRIGLTSTAKALRSNNACKSCGLGMGGQRGGMVNELGEFPAVCNKSIQAQSTDIQPPIPAEIFQHSLDELRDLSRHELEHLGRLGHPIYKPATADRYREVSWEWALSHAADALRAIDPSRAFFYSSGRSSNEAGFVLQLLARLYGTNNVNNCSYYCHQATSVALKNTIGTGTSTVELADLDGCDLFFLIGANPASNHPRLLHKLIDLRRRGGTVIVINPLRESGLVRFAAPKKLGSFITGGTDIASVYLQPRTGSDIPLLIAIAKAVKAAGGVDRRFVAEHVNGGTALEDFLDSRQSEELAAACGIDQATINDVAARYCASKNTVFAWGMGVTHHAHGVDNIEWICNLALLRGMVGRPFAGLLPLRGHSNVQGIGTIGVTPVLASEILERIESAYATKLPQAPGLHTLAAMESAAAGLIDAAVMMGGNLLDASPNRAWAEQAMDQIGFKLFLTTTLNHGHVYGVDRGEALVLPVCARDEEPEPTTQESMFNYVRLSDGGIERIASVKSEVAVLADIAARLLPNSPVDFAEFKRHRKVREAIARVVPGMEQLADIDEARREFHVRGRLLHTPEFRTEDGRANFVLPVANGSHTLAARPFRLMSIRSEGQFNTIVYEDRDTYRGVTQRWTLLMNQHDALALGVNDGEHVDVRSNDGEMRNLQVRLFNLPRGCVAAYFPEANALTARDTDPRSHTPAFKSVAVSITRS